MITLAIDASTHSTGWALFDDKKLLNSGCITASSKNLIERINKMVNGITEILDNSQVDKIVLEEVRPEKDINMQTYKALMWLQAGIAFAVYNNKYKTTIEYVYPNSWRAACGIHTGRGIKREQLKPADIKFVHDNYNLDVNDDEADSICIGHAYVNQLQDEFNWEE